jgi:N-methylhydantoinase A
VVGVDTGGTFTDFVVVEPGGGLHVIKRPSIPTDPSLAIAAGLTDLRHAGQLQAGYTLVHGTTVATNALLERRGARIGLITTAGFRDVPAIGRQTRANLYSLHPTRPEPLLPRERRLEVAERLDAQGNALAPLDEAGVEAALEALAQDGVESVAVCLLFSYLNAAHERRVGELAAARGFTVSLSADISPEPREYERMTTALANAYVAPIMRRYLSGLQTRLESLDCRQLRVMQSNGGALSVEEAAGHAIKTALSGPAGGVIAAGHLSRAAGFPDLLTFDMGGTSTDVALLRDGRCPTVTTGEMAGMPLRTPLLDIHTVGAGGGSLVRVDPAGGLRVGPQSAGADPGPVAYGRGDHLTVTDAHVLLGRLPADLKLGGRLPLDVERVRARFALLAQQLGCTVERAAEGVIAIANAAMTRALRHISVERGHDPARFALLCFGGAGGLHACELAQALNMATVIVPPFPGAFSALGLALADVRREAVRALSARQGRDWQAQEMRATLEEIFRALLADAARAMEADRIVADRIVADRIVADRVAADRIAADAWHGEFALELRYVGQSFSLSVPVDAALNPDAALNAFHRAHLHRYGHADPREPVEAVAVRLAAVAPRRVGPLRSSRTGNGGATCDVHLCVAERWQTVPVYARASLIAEGASASFSGPCVITQEDATTYVPPGWRGEADEHGNLILRVAK